MKSVKIMLSGIFVVAIAASALAFKAKSPNTCAYARTLTGGPAVTTCPFVAGINATIQANDLTKYATTIARPPQGCPLTTTCGRNVTLELE